MNDQPKRIVVFLPNWVGDAVMFTPTLRAIRAHFGQAHITLFGRPGPAAALTPNPWSDEIQIDPRGLLASVSLLRRGRYDLAVLGPNSFRSALMARLSARRIAGFDRDGRGCLLSMRVKVPRSPDGGYLVMSALDYYLLLADALDAPSADKRMELGVAPADAATAGALFNQARIDPARPVVLLNPGASFGTSKMYPPERFAVVADALMAQRGAQIVINAGPGEQPIAQELAGRMATPPALNLAQVKNSLGLVKAIVSRCALMITNDTGPRHFAAALNVPVVTIFGSTDPDWTTIYYAKERIVKVDVPCGPCQQKLCRMPPGPEHHQCMLHIDPQMVVRAALELLDGTSP